jgi:polyphosphate glucokinase
LKIDKHMNILGIDIGGSGMKGVPVNTLTGELVTERFRIPTPQPAEPAAVADGIKQIVDHFEWTGKIGCTMPGIVQKGVLKMMGNFPPVWVGMNAETLFQEKTGLPVKILNDADAAGLGELYFGKAEGRMGTVIVLTFGTGVGSALICDGHLVPNAELGHLTRKNTIWEKYCADKIRKVEKLSWQEWSKRVNEYLAYLELLFSPDMFVIGGGVANKTDKYWEHLHAERAEIVPAQLKNNAGIVGAALAAR